MNPSEDPLREAQSGMITSRSARDARDQTRSARENSREELDRRLDEALEETFPASDPVSVMIC